jgi:hypothetical protein
LFWPLAQGRARPDDPRDPARSSLGVETDLHGAILPAPFPNGVDPILKSLDVRFEDNAVGFGPEHNFPPIRTSRPSSW